MRGKIDGQRSIQPITMEKTQDSKNTRNECEEVLSNECEEVLATLPKVKNWDGHNFHLEKKQASKSTTTNGGEVLSNEDEEVLATPPKVKNWDGHNFHLEKTQASKSSTNGGEVLSNEYEKVLATLPKVKNWDGQNSHLETIQASKSTTIGGEVLSNECEEVLATLPKVKNWDGHNFHLEKTQASKSTTNGGEVLSNEAEGVLAPLPKVKNWDGHNFHLKKTQASKSSTNGGEVLSNEYEKVLATLPKVKNWDGLNFYKYHGFWIHSKAINGMISFQQHFKAFDTDIILVTAPKSGTTWLKALAFAIVNRAHIPLNDTHPLLSSSPQELVSFFEFDLYAKNELPDLKKLPNPRIFATHTPHSLLPPCVLDTDCRIVYLCRNPLDQFISHWFFLAKLSPEIRERPSLDEGLETFCEGFDAFGPFWDHVLEFWKASLEKPNKVLFLKYEDLKEDIVSQSKKLANFLGFPFSEEEEDQGVVEEITKLCSFENLKNLEANKNGNTSWNVPRSAFFRKGGVGDWANFLTPSMVQKIEKLMEEKFTGTGISFQISSQDKMEF